MYNEIFKNNNILYNNLSNEIENTKITQEIFEKCLDYINVKDLNSVYLKQLINFEKLDFVESTYNDLKENNNNSIFFDKKLCDKFTETEFIVFIFVSNILNSINEKTLKQKFLLKNSLYLLNQTFSNLYEYDDKIYNLVENLQYKLNLSDSEKAILSRIYNAKIAIDLSLTIISNFGINKILKFYLFIIEKINLQDYNVLPKEYNLFKNHNNNIEINVTKNFEEYCDYLVSHTKYLCDCLIDRFKDIFIECRTNVKELKESYLTDINKKHNFIKNFYYTTQIAVNYCIYYKLIKQKILKNYIAINNLYNKILIKYDENDLKKMLKYQKKEDNKIIINNLYYNVLVLLNLIPKKIILSFLYLFILFLIYISIL